MKFNALVLLTSGLLAACGTQTKKNEQPTPAVDQGVNVASTADAETAKALPTLIVAKVPLDAQGNELTDQGEARELFGPADATGGETADAAFAQGAQVTIADELDRDSSSAQWHNRGYYWSTPWYPGKVLGRGLWWGRNPYVHYNNNSYGYNYTSYYSYNNCNYYTYRPSYGGYNSYDNYGRNY